MAGGFTLEYLINMRDAFSAAAERVAKSAAEAKAAISGMGKSSAQLDGQLLKAAEGMSRVAAGAEKAGLAVGAYAKANSRAAQESARFTELQIKQMNRIEKLEQSMYERHVARQNLIKSGAIPERGGGRERVGFMGGMFALSMMHNDVFKTWENFDDIFRKINGTLAGSVSPRDLKSLRASAIATAKGTRFSPDDIAKIMLTEASNGVPLTQRTADGRLLGGVIAKQMLGIATGTGEDPANTFSTHLKIMRGFKLAFEAFPHISDTIALLHNQTGASMKQIETQMGNVAAAAGASGWTEEQTAGALGVLTKHGVGQLSGVGLRRIIEQSTKDWSKTQKAGWKSLHVTQDMLRDPKTGGVISPAAFAKLLEDHTKGMKPFDIEKAMAQIFGSKAATVGTQLLGSSKELQTLTYMLEHVEGLAEKMGEFGAQGGAAGVARFGAAWERLKTSIGETGFGEHVGWLASKFGDLFDTIAGGPNWAKEATGWAAGAMNALSAAALPLMAIEALGGFRALGGLLKGALWLTGLSQLKNLGSAITILASGAASASSRLWGLVAPLMTIGRITGAGALILAGYEIYQHWSDIKKVLSEVWELMKNIASGNTKAAKGNAASITKTLGFGDHESAVMENRRYNALRAGDVLGALGRSYLPTKEKMQHAKDLIAEAEALKAKYHAPPPRFYPRGAPSAADAAANAQAAAAHRAQTEFHVRSTIDPIQLHVPPSVTLQGTLTGNGVTANVHGSMPMSATAPRGRTMAEPAAPRVAQ